MSNKYSLKIYRSIIQYLIYSAGYTPKQIANLANSSIENIQSIYYDNILPKTADTHLQLLRLYSLIIELREHSLKLDI